MILIAGAGYAGLNAYYNIKSKNKYIIADRDEFVFYTSYLRNIVEPKRYKVPLNFVKKERVLDIDLNGLVVKTDKGVYEPDILIVALGCKRKGIDELLNIRNMDNICVSAEDKYDSYLALQTAFYAKNIGKNVKYSGNYMEWLGSKVGEVIRKEVEEKLGTCEYPNFIIPACEPPEIGFLKVNQYLEVKPNVYAIGDIIDGWPKLGELAMRSGKYVGELINSSDRKVPFKPIFIHILDFGDRGIHIRSNVPWGGDFQEVKISILRRYMKRFIENYYIWRKGNMGFLYYL